MLRRVIAILLLFPLLGSQMPAFPHTHAGTGVAEPEDHAARPHVHLHADGGHHHHHGSDHHDHHQPATEEPSDDKSDDVMSVAVNAASDHDTDALYLPNAVTYGVSRKTAFVESSKQVVALLALDFRAAESDGAITESLSTRPPPGTSVRCPLYLRTLSLRI